MGWEKDDEAAGAGGGEAAAASEAEPSEAEPSEAEPSEADASATPAPTAGSGAVVIDLDEDGAGAAMVGLDVDDVTLGRPSPCPPGCEVSVGPSHTVSIARVAVTGGPPGGSVTVPIVPKR